MYMCLCLVYNMCCIIDVQYQGEKIYDEKTACFVICFMTVFSMTVNCYAMDLMQNGSRGDDVREVQEMLISQGYLNDDADGIFGPKTEAAVRAFQQEKGLDATGIVGEGTYNALKTKRRGQEMRESGEEQTAETTQSCRKR